MAATAQSPRPPESSTAEGEGFETVRLKSGGYAVKAPFRPGRPVFVYGFRSAAEAWAWIERTGARLAK